MRKLFLLSWWCVLGSVLATADEPKPGTIVIKPNAPPVVTPSTPVTPSPDKPGTIVIRPQAPGTTPRSIETPKTSPVSPDLTPKGPIATPVPIADPKPVEVPGATPKVAPKAAADEGKLISEAYDVVYVKGYKVGYFHVVIREHVRDGKTLLYSTKTQEITVGRFGQNVTTRADDATLEDTEGNVLVVRMSQEVSSGPKLAITGTVDGQMLRVKGEGQAAAAESVPWPEGVIGISKEFNLYKDRKPKPGDTFDYNMWEGRLNRVVKFEMKCLALENIALVEGQPAKPTLKFEAQMAKIGVFQLPAATIWVDAATYEPLRTDQDLPSLGGKMTSLRTTKEVALRPVGKVPDLFDVQSIKLDKVIPNVHDKGAVTYKIDLKIDPEPFSCFAKDDRQFPKLTGETKKTVELRALHHRLAAVAEKEPEPKDLPLCLGKSFFIDWDNDLTKKQAKLAIANMPMTATNRDKVTAIEKWVKQNIRSVEFSQAMSPTSEVSKTLSGDCTEYSMLSVGLCRANGIPARTVLGLVYADVPNSKPVLAYHMWFEAWLDGRWVPFDATLGRGGIGPGHLKITTSHWDKENSFAPLLPVLRVLIAQPKVEVGLVEELK
ncbi:hypothetical protein BH11PLA2_BH11PLA2_06210 [soil metagenome]